MLIDSQKFSREQHTAHGTLPIAAFARLRDNLIAQPGADDQVRYEVRGGVDARERPLLRLTVSGQLPLQCQRCLKALDYDLAIDTAVRLVAEAALDAEMSDDPDEPDCIAASTELDLVALIEDEILLALPAYPRHEDRDGGCGGMADEAGSKKNSAFSVLSTLKTL